MGKGCSVYREGVFSYRFGIGSQSKEKEGDQYKGGRRKEGPRVQGGKGKPKGRRGETTQTKICPTTGLRVEKPTPRLHKMHQGREE